jgi:hypothetical protein
MRIPPPKLLKNLMNQCRCLERLTGRLVFQPLGSQSPELLVDQGQQLFGRLASALPD